jgi:hypothetical protein
MIKNYYYLVAGILAILFAISHAWNGQTTVLPSINVDKITADTKTIFSALVRVPTNHSLQSTFAIIKLPIHKHME